MDERAPISDPRPRRALHRAHRALELELRGFMRPELADALLEAALERVMHESPEDPGRRLRAVVGARLLDDVADLLTRVGDRMQIDETPTVSVPLELAPEPVRLETGIDERADRSRIRRRWSHERAVARRGLG